MKYALAKVTPLLLAPLLLAALAWHGCQLRVGVLETAFRGLIGAVCCLFVCGWYYIRNWVLLGKPFVGGWDPASGNTWWQDPGYRTWAQLLTAGKALERPVYSGSWSLGDALYSTLWLDGFACGVQSGPSDFRWNLSWMTAGALLALLPSLWLVLSPLTIWKRELQPVRAMAGFAWAAIAIYLAVLTELFMKLPVYSTAKATYLLGLTPCLALLAAVGASVGLRWRFTRALTFAGLACWGFAAYLAYFSMTMA